MSSSNDQNSSSRESTKPKTREEVMRLSETPYRDCVGCPHYFVQIRGHMAECTICSLGVYGVVGENGQLTK